MKRILFDCDNTMGIPDCDVDDAHALYYLMEQPVEVIGVTTSHGNSDVESVYRATQELFAKNGWTMPCKKGGSPNSEAAQFLVESAKKYDGALTVLVTGATTNLYHAYLLDSQFFERVELVLMGGITAPLIFDKKEMAELNLSVDAEATACMLTHAPHIAIITANNCLPSLYSKAELFDNLTTARGKRIAQESAYYFEYYDREYGIQGHYNWDAVAAMYVCKPELFTAHTMTVASTAEDLGRGFLRSGDVGRTIRVPEIRSVAAFKEALYRGLNGAEE